MTAVLLVLIGAASGAVLVAWVYRFGREDEVTEQRRWERAETGLTDVSPAVVPDLTRLAIRAARPRPRHAATRAETTSRALRASRAARTVPRLLRSARRRTSSSDAPEGGD